MKQVDEMPTSGQFVAVWQYNGKIWSGVYINRGEWIDVYLIEDDDFERNNAETVKNHLEKQSAKYFIAE